MNLFKCFTPAKKFVRDNPIKCFAVGAGVSAGITAIVAPKALISAASLMGTGCLLGLGFWGAKQITNKIDEIRLLNDKEFMNSLKTPIESPL